MSDRPRIVSSRPGGPQDQAVAAAAEGLSPERSLERVEATAKLVFANVAAVATVLTGLGFVGDVGGALQRGSHIAGVPVTAALVASSLLLASFALTPSLRRVRTGDADAVRRFYTVQIARRGLAALLAMLALAAAIVSAVDVAADDSDPGRALGISSQLTRSGKDVTVAAAARAGGLRAGDWLRLQVTATGSPARSCEAVGVPDATGAASVRCPRSTRKRGGAITVTAQVLRGQRVVRSRSTTLRP